MDEQDAQLVRAQQAFNLFAKDTALAGKTVVRVEFPDQFRPIANLYLEGVEQPIEVWGSAAADIRRDRSKLPNRIQWEAPPDPGAPRWTPDDLKADVWRDHAAEGMSVVALALALRHIADRLWSLGHKGLASELHSFAARVKDADTIDAPTE